MEMVDLKREELLQQSKGGVCVCGGGRGVDYLPPSYLLLFVFVFPPFLQAFSPSTSLFILSFPTFIYLVSFMLFLLSFVLFLSLLYPSFPSFFFFIVLVSPHSFFLSPRPLCIHTQIISDLVHFRSFFRSLLAFQSFK